jgi:hypothetical protein
MAMFKRCVSCCAVVLALGLGFTGAASGASLVGFNDHFALWHGDLPGDPQGTTLKQYVGGAAGAHANVMRVPFEWSTAESSAGVWNEAAFQQYDTVYNALESQAVPIAMIIVPIDAPNWARAANTQLTQPSSVSVCAGQKYESWCMAPPSPSYYSEYYALVKKLALRYPKAAAIEIWNEPNTVHFWHPQPNVNDYSNLLSGVKSALSSAGSSMTVLNGGLAGLDANSGANSAKNFLSGIYQYAHSTSFDGISFHAYPVVIQPLATGDPLQPLYDRTNDVTTVRNANADPGKQLWLTELGACGVDPSSLYYCAGNGGGNSGQGGWVWSEADQGTILVNAYHWVQSKPGFAAMVFHSLIEESARRDSTSWAPTGYDRDEETQAYGLIKWATGATDPNTTSYLRKTAYCQLATAIGGSCG